MGWERKRGKLHELNRLLRGRPTRRSSRPTGGAPPRPRRPLRHHSRRRHPAAARRGLASGRHDRASAQPGHSSMPGAARGRGLRHPPAARDADAARPTGGSIFQRIFSGPAGVDPYASAVSDVYQDLFGEGSTRARASTTSTLSRPPSTGACPRTRCSATISSRASSRGPAWSRTSSSSRSSPRTTKSPPRASTAGCAATGSCLPWICAARGGSRAIGALEDARQSPPHPLRAAPCHAAGGLDLPGAAPSSGRVRPRRSSVPALLRVLGASSRAGADLQAKLRRRGRRGLGSAWHSWSSSRLPRASGLADGRTRSCARSSVSR